MEGQKITKEQMDAIKEMNDLIVDRKKIKDSNGDEIELPVLMWEDEMKLTKIISEVEAEGKSIISILGEDYCDEKRISKLFEMLEVYTGLKKEELKKRLNVTDALGVINEYFDMRLMKAQSKNYQSLLNVASKLKEFGNK